MNILMTGGTGLIGRALIKQLHNHKITVLTRSPNKAKTLLPSGVNMIENLNQSIDFNAIDAVINLAGEPIIGKRWNKRQKERITASRWEITQTLVTQIQAAQTPPHTFISGSAVGYYGNQGDNIIDETTKVNDADFAHVICAKWEEIALQASDRSRVCLLRTGIVLSKNGGALTKMLLPYQLGLGGPISSGEQYMSWVHIDDIVGGILHLLHHKLACGAFNLTAPNPVRNKEFSQILAQLLRRPHFLMTPKWLMALALGEASQILLDSQRAIPRALENSGYHCKYPELKAALNDVIAEI